MYIYFASLYSLWRWQISKQQSFSGQSWGKKGGASIRRRGLFLSDHHKWACSELWSLSWLSSSLAKESVEWWRAAMPENSEGSSVPFFTLTSSFSRASAPCWPPFTRFHFILLFWNQTFTYRGHTVRGIRHTAFWFRLLRREQTTHFDSWVFWKNSPAKILGREYA